MPNPRACGDMRVSTMISPKMGIVKSVNQVRALLLLRLWLMSLFAPRQFAFDGFTDEGRHAMGLGPPRGMNNPYLGKCSEALM